MDHHVSSLVVRRWEEGAGEEVEGAERKVGEGAERKVGEVAAGREVGVGRELAVGELLLTFHLSIRWCV